VLRTLLVLGALAALPGTAFAADGDDAKAEAKALADAAYDKMQQGRFDEALELFRKADEAYHSPLFVVFMGDAEAKLGRLTVARDLYKRAAEETLPPDAPDSFAKAQADARDRLAKIEKRIPRLDITIAGGDASTSVAVDGHTLSPDELGGPFPVDPGRHEVVATGGTGTSVAETVEVAEGDVRDVVLELGATPVEPPDDGGGGGTGWIPVAVGYGVGGAGLIMGIAAGAVFLDELGGLRERCEALSGDENRCAPEEAGEGDDIEVLGNVSTAGFVIAGVGAAVGTVFLVLWMTDGGDESETNGDAALGLTPGGVELRGRF
jgi:hypothetical protein